MKRLPNNHYSPLRYPGGKTRLLPFIKDLIKQNNLIDKGVYIEPYVGGGGVALGLLFDDYVSEIIINDLDNGIYSFWKTIIEHNDDFIKKIIATDISIKEWHKQNEIYRTGEIGFDLGFSTFFLNRCNYSGVITGGCIGGLNQDGQYKLDCRFKKEVLINKISAIKKHRNKIKVYNYDTLKLLNTKKIKSYLSNSIMYLDPPYFIKGVVLYRNHYSISDHNQIADVIKSIDAHWLVSYDNVEEIQTLYSDCRKIEFNIQHHAGNVKRGKEVIFFSDHFVHIPEKLCI